MVDPQLLDEWLGKLREGTLAKADLQQAVARLKEDGAASRPQRLLYLQTQTTAVDSAVKGMSVVENGKVHETGADLAPFSASSTVWAMSSKMMLSCVT